MTEINERPHEEKFAQVTDWITKIGTEGKVYDIDPQLVKSVLIDLGAKTEILEEERAPLTKYSNFNKRPGLDAVWGKEKVDAYKEWVKTIFIPQYEEKVGRQLHTLWDPKKMEFDDNKHSGMMQFLGELTAFALGAKSFEDYKRLTEDRIRKGFMFENEDPNEPYVPSKHSSIPPEFPRIALNYLIYHKFN